MREHVWVSVAESFGSDGDASFLVSVFVVVYPIYHKH